MLMQKWLDAAEITDPEIRRCYTAAVRRLGAESSPQLDDFLRWTVLFPAALRPFGAALASMLRTADLRADGGAPAERLRRIDEYERAVLAAIAEGDSDDPVLLAVAHMFARLGLRTSYLKETFGAMRRDAVFTPFATYGELRSWAEAMTGAFSMILGPLFFYPRRLAEAEPLVRAMGALEQIADNLYDLAEDLRNGRLYLPLEDLARFGVTPDDLFQGRWVPAVAELLAFEVARARGVGELATALLPCAYPSVRPLLRTWALGVEAYLDEVLAAGPLLLRRSPPMRRYRWLNAVFPAGLPRETARREEPAPGAPGTSDHASDPPPAAPHARAAVQAELHRWVKNDGTWLGLLCRDALLPAGNLLRPVLCLESARTTGGTTAGVLPFSAGLSCLHAGSLVHDQVLDRRARRCHQTSMRDRAGFEDLLLAGDGLFGDGALALIGAWEDGAPAEHVLSALRSVLHSLEVVCRATLLESTLHGDVSAELGRCLAVIRGKSAVPMQVACEAGGLLVGAPPAQVQALGRFGHALGMALQIHDEVLALTHEPRPPGAGRTHGCEVENRQPPLPVLLAHARADAADRLRLAEIFSRAESSLGAHRELGERVARTGALEAAARLAHGYAMRARAALAELPPSESRDRLAALIPASGDGDQGRACDAAPAEAPALPGHGAGARAPSCAETERLADLPAAIEAELHRRVRSDGDRLSQMCSDALFPSGKLLRPVLCLESALAVGGAVREALPFAAGLECIHVASLIHDDLLDQDALRRGRESLPHRYGIEDALLAGDGLLAKGILSMIGARDGGVPAERLMAALRVVAEALRAECRAAMLESMLRHDLSIDLALPLEVIRGKTAALMQAACESGGILAGAPPAQVRALGRYGEALGMAFQIRDDLLPYISDTHTIGKAVTSDAKNRHPTLPILLAQSLAGEADRRRLQALFSGTEDSPAVHHQMRELLSRTGAIEEAMRRAREHVACARAALSELPPSESRDRLADLITTVIDRDR